MASINRGNLVNHLRVSASIYREAVINCAETPRVAEAFRLQAEEAEALFAALESGEPVTITGN